MTIVDSAIYVDGRRTADPESLRETHEAAREHGGVVWIGLYKPTAEEFASVAEEFGLHELAVEDAIQAHQRPKLERYGGNLAVRCGTHGPTGCGGRTTPVPVQWRKTDARKAPIFRERTPIPVPPDFPRRLLLLGPPLALVPLMAVHQLVDQLQRPGAFLWLHLILLPLFALVGASLWALLDGVGGAAVRLARAAAFVFAVGYVAFDAVSGVAASVVLASGAPGAGGAARALWAAGPGGLPLAAALWAWRAAVLAGAYALWRAGRPVPPLAVLLATALWLNADHGGLRGIVVFGGFALAAAWLESAPRRPNPVKR